MRFGVYNGPVAVGSMKYPYEMSIPPTTRTWRVEGSNGFDSLIFNKAEPNEVLQDNQVLVRIRAVALNYRDASIPHVSRPHSKRFYADQPIGHLSFRLQGRSGPRVGRSG